MGLLPRLTAVFSCALIAACSSGSGIGEDDDPPERRDRKAGASGGGGRSGSGGKPSAAGAGGLGGTAAAGATGGVKGDVAGAGGTTAGVGGGPTQAGASGGGGLAGTGVGGSAGVATGGQAGKGGASPKGGAAGAAGQGSGAAAGKAGSSPGSGGAGAGGKSGAGGSPGQGGAGGGGAGATIAGQGGSGGSGGGSAGGGTGGSGGASCTPTSPTELCYNGRDDDCSGEQDELCPPLALAGNWRWTFDFDGKARRTSVGLSGGGDLLGRAIDEFGLATLTGAFDSAAKTFSITKRYESGYELVYTGTATFSQAGVTASGTWHPTGAPANTSGFTGVLQDARAASTVSGAWDIAAYFDPSAVASFAVTDEGLLEGIMSDTFGAASLLGVFDRGDGLLFFKKTYGNGDLFWYRGVVAADGTSIGAGTVGDTAATTDLGAWTGAR